MTFNSRVLPLAFRPTIKLTFVKSDLVSIHALSMPSYSEYVTVLSWINTCADKSPIL